MQLALNEIRTKIAKTCTGCGRDASTITLVAVSKTHTVDKIEELIRLGVKTFGENRVQEAEEKFPVLREKYPDLKLHLIGHLQSNKVKKAVALFDVIETLDSIDLADELAHEMKKQERNLPCFIQVNTGAEDQKAGVLIENLPALLDHAVNKASLNIIGLMCIPPVGEPSDFHFALLADWAKRLSLKSLSMGMSADFETAIRYNATHVRVGTALFGARDISS